jgi:hypothetical protein
MPRRFLLNCVFSALLYEAIQQAIVVSWPSELARDLAAGTDATNRKRFPFVTLTCIVIQYEMLG